MRIFISIFLLISLIFACKNTNQSTENIPIKASNLSGETLAKTYCASCHLFPEPNLLDKATWQNGVLPKMYARMGLEQDSFNLFSSMDLDEMQAILGAGIYPEKPMIAKEDWVKIVKYYIDNAPQAPLVQDKKSKIKIGLSKFLATNIFAKSNEIPSATLVKFVPDQKGIFIGFRGNNNSLKKYDLSLKRIDSIAVTSPVSAILPYANLNLGVLAMGVMDPNDKKEGSFQILNNLNGQKQIIKDSLQRPVDIVKADLNLDKIDDYIICNFGNELGQVIWIDGKTKKENILNSNPGGRKAYVKDMNNDQKPDIILLMTQAREQIVAYLNQGNGQFKEKVLLEFPPVYGSSYFELADFNKDGFQDILYTNGDNADYSIVLKKYHGVRIFSNDGKNNFKQTYFYPMHGASKAKAADFDLDGDLDIAAISFFTDPNQKPNEGFLLFDNQGTNESFKVSTTSEAKNGKWMVMDVADMDLDGDMDIILGSFKLKMAREFNQKPKKQIQALILQNLIK
jgi:FG-GAP-like repeat